MSKPPKPRKSPVAKSASETGDQPFEYLPLLETSRTKWRRGEWKDLASIPLQKISEHADRAKIALLVAAAKAQLGKTDEARALIRQARAWGCSRDLMTRVIASGIHNSLGKIAACLENDSGATRHFEAAFDIVEADSDTPLLARTRRVRETAQMGLLPDAAKILGADMSKMRAAPIDHSARLASMRTELDLLNHELSLALRRGQIMNPEAIKPGSQGRLATRAVSQLGQDLWVIEQTGAKRNGFFVEFGATDGVRLSNTWLLETEFDWTGICAEPNPVMFEQLRANRRCMTSTACIGGVSGQNVEFILADAFGGIADYAMADHHAQRRDDFRRDGQTMRVTTVSLEDFLVAHNAPREIDYMSIDTEGSEYEILRHFPFDQWSIRLITVEHNRTPMREKIRQLLEPLGYQRTEMDFDDWYSMKQ